MNSVKLVNVFGGCMTVGKVKFLYFSCPKVVLNALWDQFEFFLMVNNVKYYHLTPQ